MKSNRCTVGQSFSLTDSTIIVIFQFSVQLLLESGADIWHRERNDNSSCQSIPCVSDHEKCFSLSFKGFLQKSPKDFIPLNSTIFWYLIQKIPQLQQFIPGNLVRTDLSSKMKSFRTNELLFTGETNALCPLMLIKTKDMALCRWALISSPKIDLLAFPRCIYSVCFLYTFPAERNGTVSQN